MKAILYGNGIELQIYKILEINDLIENWDINISKLIEDSTIANYFKAFINIQMPKTSPSFEDRIIYTISNIKKQLRDSDKFTEIGYVISNAVNNWIDDNHKKATSFLSNEITNNFSKVDKSTSMIKISRKDAIVKGLSSGDLQSKKPLGILEKLERILYILSKISDYDLIVTTNYRNLLWANEMCKNAIFQILRLLDFTSYEINSMISWVNDDDDVLKERMAYIEVIINKNSISENFKKKLLSIFKFFYQINKHRIGDSIKINNYISGEEGEFMFVDGADDSKVKKEVFEDDENLFIPQLWKNEVMDKISKIRKFGITYIDIIGWHPDNDIFLIESFENETFKYNFFIFSEENEKSISRIKEAFNSSEANYFNSEEFYSFGKSN